MDVCHDPDGDAPPRIHILDVVIARPGAAAAFRTRYRADYAPAAQRRGMRLDGAWQSPPVDIAALPTTLYYLWSVADVAGWWAMRLSRLPDGRDERFDKHAFWQDAEPLLIGRERRMLGAQPREA